MEYSIPESRAVRTEQAAKALRLIEDALVESVQAAGALGAPGGILYAALMTHGFTLEQFERIMGYLVKLGKLEKRGDLYFAKGVLRKFSR